jgi:hypothetical protein
MRCWRLASRLALAVLVAAEYMPTPPSMAHIGGAGHDLTEPPLVFLAPQAPQEHDEGRRKLYTGESLGCLAALS